MIVIRMRTQSSARAYPLMLFLLGLQSIYKCNFKSANFQVQFTGFAQPQDKFLLLLIFFPLLSTRICDIFHGILGCKISCSWPCINKSRVLAAWSSSIVLACGAMGREIEPPPEYSVVAKKRRQKIK
jgi:hypothetical protein